MLLDTSTEELEGAAPAKFVEDVISWLELDAAGAGPVAVTSTVAMIVVDICIVVTAPD